MHDLPRRRRLAGMLAIGLILLVPSAGIATAHDGSVGGRADVTIEIGARNLDPSVRVRVGSVVRFVNRDGERHRMRARTGPTRFDTGDLDPGESFAVRLPTAGTIAYADERDRDDLRYHGRIEVVAASAAPTTAGGTGSAGGVSGGGTGAGPAPDRATVTIEDDFFDPGTVRIARGGTVTFRNTGGDEHSATSAAFDTGTLVGGASAQAMFPDAGSFAFICIFHSDMRGTIEVLGAGTGGPTPTAAPSALPDASTSPSAAASPSAPASSPPGPAAGGGPSTTEASIVDFAFDPGEIAIEAGDTVAWRNDGAAPHTVTATDGSFDSGTLARGGTFERTFDAPGRFPYLCALHPDMIGTIVVEESSTAVASAVATVPDRTPVPGPAEAAREPSSIDAGTAGDVAALGGLVGSIVLVSTAAALFARLIRGTVRS